MDLAVLQVRLELITCEGDIDVPLAIHCLGDWAAVEVGEVVAHGDDESHDRGKQSQSSWSSNKEEPYIESRSRVVLDHTMRIKVSLSKCGSETWG